MTIRTHHYEIDFSVSSGAVFESGNNNITDKNYTPDSTVPVDSITFAQNMPNTVSAKAVVSDTTPAVPPGNTGSVVDSSGTVKWNFQKGTNPPTVAIEDSRIPNTLTSATTITTYYDVGSPYYNDQDDMSQFTGWTEHESFSNFSGTGFTASNMDPNWLSKNGYTTETPVGVIAQALFTSSFTTSDAEIGNNGMFQDMNSAVFPSNGFATGFISDHTITVTVTQSYSCGANVLCSVQLTYTLINGAGTVTKTVPPGSNDNPH